MWDRGGAVGQWRAIGATVSLRSTSLLAHYTTVKCIFPYYFDLWRSNIVKLTSKNLKHALDVVNYVQALKKEVGLRFLYFILGVFGETGFSHGWR